MIINNSIKGLNYKDSLSQWKKSDNSQAKKQSTTSEPKKTGVKLGGKYLSDMVRSDKQVNKKEIEKQDNVKKYDDKARLSASQKYLPARRNLGVNVDDINKYVRNQDGKRKETSDYEFNYLNRDPNIAQEDFEFGSLGDYDDISRLIRKSRTDYRIEDDLSNPEREFTKNYPYIPEPQAVSIKDPESQLQVPTELIASTQSMLEKKLRKELQIAESQDQYEIVDLKNKINRWKQFSEYLEKEVFTSFNNADDALVIIDERLQQLNEIMMGAQMAISNNSDQDLNDLRGYAESFHKKAVEIIETFRLDKDKLLSSDKEFNYQISPYGHYSFERGINIGLHAKFVGKDSEGSPREFKVDLNSNSIYEVVGDVVIGDPVVLDQDMLKMDKYNPKTNTIDFTIWGGTDLEQKFTDFKITEQGKFNLIGAWYYNNFETPQDVERAFKSIEELSSVKQEALLALKIKIDRFQRIRSDAKRKLDKFSNQLVKLNQDIFDTKVKIQKKYEKQFASQVRQFVLSEESAQVRTEFTSGKTERDMFEVDPDSIIDDILKYQ